MTFCTFGKMCVVYDRQSKIPGLSHGKPLCEGCTSNGKSTLNMLRYDYVDLSQLIPKADARNDTHIFRPKPESSPPMNMQVFGLRADISYTVALIAKHVRRATGSPQPRWGAPVREGYALDADVRFLGARLYELAALPATTAYWEPEQTVTVALDGLQLLLRLRDLHRRSRKVCGLDPRTVTMPGACPICDTSSLRRHDDDIEKIWCLHCKLQLTKIEYGRVVRLQYTPPPAPRNLEE